MDNAPIGYKAICEKLQLKTLPHYRESYLTPHGRGKAITNQTPEIYIYAKTYALADETNLLAQLEFALKYDGINLAIIKSLFEKIKKSEITNHIKQQPSGIYKRKIWFLYEFLMNDLLDIPDCEKIKYADLLDAKLYFTNKPIKSQRHAINNNLLGNKEFCPFIRRTNQLEKDIGLHLDDEAKKILKKYDHHLITRACFYLYTKETMSSYQIEKEQPDKDRISRFIRILQQAPAIEMITKDKLIELQNIIVDPRFHDFDYRHNQNYVGENINAYFQRLHYISPKPEDVTTLMDGLLSALQNMLSSNIHPVILAAAIAFGFVFIHPFEDGNGRIHRFLIHYILAKQEFTPREMIFPVSSIMLKNMDEYDKALETFSIPLLRVLKNYHLDHEGTLIVKQDSKLFYQYIDFTNIAEYLFSCIEDTIKFEIEKEIQFLAQYDESKKQIQSIIDMPDKQIDLFIKMVLQNNGQLSPHKRNRFFSFLTDDEVAELSQIVRSTMITDKK